MALNEHPLSALQHFLPSRKAYKYCISLLDNQGIELQIKKERKSIYGNFKIEYDHRGKNTMITINGNLPPYQFYFTLLHELAHYYTTIKYGTRVKPHGAEWKSIFSEYLKESLRLQIFPSEIISHVEKYAQNPKATSCSDSSLQIALYQLENTDSQWNLLELCSLQEGTKIVSKDGKRYIYVKKLRKNHLLKSQDMQQEYIAPPTLLVRTT